jgi:hypothetical protein
VPAQAQAQGLLQGCVCNREAGGRAGRWAGRRVSRVDDSGVVVVVGIRWWQG